MELDSSRPRDRQVQRGISGALVKETIFKDDSVTIALSGLPAKECPIRIQIVRGTRVFRGDATT